MTVKLDIRKTDDGSAFAFHFDRIFISDIHWGTKHSNAEALNVFVDLLSARKISLGGDIIDLEKIKRWEKDLPPSHFEGMGKFIQRAHEGTQVDFKPGNHDFPLRGRKIEHKGELKAKNNIFEKQIAGITFLDREVYKGNDGRTVLHLHGDQFDSEIAKKKKGFVYKTIDGAYSLIQEVDWGLNRIGIRSRIGPTIKKVFKSTINKALNYHEKLNATAKTVGADVVIHGHSHNLGFDTTKTGVLKIDDGCATDHVQALGQMSNGTFILMEMKDGEIRFEDEKGNMRVVNLANMAKKMGCPDFLQSLPRPVEQQYMDMTYNAMRTVYRLSPPPAHRHMVKSQRADRRELVEKFKEIAPQFGLDQTIADKAPSIAAPMAFAAVHALPPDVITDNWNNGIKRVYKLAGRINAASEKLHNLPIKKIRNEKPEKEIMLTDDFETPAAASTEKEDAPEFDRSHLYPHNGF